MFDLNKIIEHSGYQWNRIHDHYKKWLKDELKSCPMGLVPWGVHIIVDENNECIKYFDHLTTATDHFPIFKPNSSLFKRWLNVNKYRPLPNIIFINTKLNNIGEFEEKLDMPIIYWRYKRDYLEDGIKYRPLMYNTITNHKVYLDTNEIKNAKLFVALNKLL